MDETASPADRTPDPAPGPDPAQAAATPAVPPRRAAEAETSRPVATLLRVNLRGWFSAKGFWLVLAAALLPTVLVGSWVATHRADVAATDVTWQPAVPREGDRVTFTATVANTGGLAVRDFNVTMAVGRVFGNQLSAENTTTQVVERLDGGATTTVTLRWTARPGVYWVLADADPAGEDKVAEKEEFNNQKALPLAVAYRTPTEAPAPPANLSGNGTAQADLRLGALCWTPDVQSLLELPCENPLGPGDRVTFRVTVTNRGPAALEGGSATLRVVRMFGASPFPTNTTTEPLSLAAGESVTLTLPWRAAEGAYWIEAFATPGGDGVDAADGDNHAATPFTVDPSLAPDLAPPAPPEKLTIKDFYLDVLSLLHLRILIPLVALFYAAGLVADERSRGTLPYLLTRPVPRWLFPVTKFAASFLVAGAAVAVGIAVAFMILFQTPQGNAGFLTTPLLASLLALFVYGAFFAWMGVVVERPYLVGVAFVLGWETIAGNFVPWVEKLTFTYHLGRVLGGAEGVATDGWRLDEGVQWLPEGAAAVGALRNVLLAGLAFLVLAAWAMKRKEFPDV